MEIIRQHTRSIKTFMASLVARVSVHSVAMVVVCALSAAVVLLPYITFPASLDIFAVLSMAVLAFFAVIYAYQRSSMHNSIPTSLIVVAASVALFMFLQAIIVGFSSTNIFGFGFSGGTLMSWVGVLFGVVSGAVLFSKPAWRTRMLYVVTIGLGLAAYANIFLAAIGAEPVVPHSNTTFSNFILFGAGLLLASGLLSKAKKISTSLFIALTASQLVFFVHILFSKSTELLLLSGLGVLVLFLFLLFAQKESPHFLRPSNILTLFFGFVLLIASFSAPVLPEQVYGVVGAANQEVRPSTFATVRVGVLEAKANPASLVLGSGPNSFREVWNMHMPQEVNTTKFWNDDFTNGSNLFLTMAIELGIPAVALLVSLLCIPVAVLLLALLRKRLLEQSELLAAFVVVFIAIAALLYAPKVVVLAVAAICAGSLIYRNREHTDDGQGIANKAHTPFFGTLFICSLIVIVFALLHIIALHAYGLGVAQLQKEPPEYANAGTRFEQSLSFAALPETYRSAALAYTGRSQRELEGQVTEGSLERAILHAQRASTFAEQARMASPLNYRTHVVLGETLLLEGILKEDVALVESALESFENAFSRAPYRLLAVFGKARALATLEQRTAESRELLLELLSQQPNYEPARELLKSLDE